MRRSRTPTSLVMQICAQSTPLFHHLRVWSRPSKMEISHTSEHRMSAAPPTVLNPGQHTVNVHSVLRSRWHAAPDIRKQEIRGAEALTVYTPTICIRCRAATPVSRPTSACGGRPVQRARCPIYAEWRSGPLHSVVQTECIGAVAQAKTIQSVRTISLAFRSRNELTLESDVAMLGGVNECTASCDSRSETSAESRTGSWGHE